MKAISDKALQQLLRQMAQTNQVGTPGFILAAGELQGRKEARQQAMLGKGNPRPVIADLLMGDAMPPQMPVLPENAGGIAALPAPNMEGIATLAGGGLVAFANTGAVISDDMLIEDAIKKMKLRDPNLNEGFIRTALADAAPDMRKRLTEDLRRKAEAVATGKSELLPNLEVPPPVAAGMSLSDVMRQATMDERRAYQQTGQLAPRLQQMLRGETAPPTAPSGPGRGTSINFDGPDVPPARLVGDQRFYPGIAPLLQRQQNPEFYAAPQDPSKAADYRAQARAADSGYYTGLAATGQNAPAAGDKATVTRVDKKDDTGVGAAPPAPPTIDYKDAFEKAGATAKELLGTAPTMPAEVTTKSVKEAVEADRKLFEELGIADPTKLRRDQIEAEMKEAKSDKEQAGWMRLAEFGFNWASQNGPALQAAAKAGAAVAPGLISDLKELKKTERAQKRELAGLAALDAQAQRDMTAKARDRLDAKYESGLRRVDENRKNIATLSASIAANAISSQTQLTTTGMTTAASRDVAKISADATLAKLAEQMAETETKNIVDAAKDLIVKRIDYLALSENPVAMDKALKDAVRTIKQARALAGTNVTKSGN